MEFSLSSKIGAALPVEVIGPIDHPSYSDNTFPTAIQNRLFPIHSRSSSDLLLYQSLLPHAVPAQFKSWPRVSANTFFFPISGKPSAEYLPVACYLTKGKKSVTHVEKSDEPSSVGAKARNRKISSAPSRPVQRSRGRKYPTRSSSRLISHFSNTDVDLVDLVSSSPISDEGEGNREGDSTPHGSPTADELTDDYFLQGQDAGLAPESDPPRIPLIKFFSYVSISPVFKCCHSMFVSLCPLYFDLSCSVPFQAFSSRRAQLQKLEGPSFDAYLSFADDEASTSSQLAKSFPSAESLSYARTAVHNFLELGLHQLGSATKAIVDELASLKDDYGDWTKEIRDSEEKQGEFLLKWVQLRRVFS
ncbi:glutamate receptor 2.7-like [Dorcoceras hygrometricum]|uniref:Glutamate receptor 2.7-like n=1 Tax=Dorcoceras hygrometricum TaxID=472368 RepID=A0A2Z7CPV6_9LAMI|nr:glutamate receptor 2.7-like [Dorcoceras hygrometricum]